MTEYKVAVEVEFEADTPEQAVDLMVEWLGDYAEEARYSVTWMYEAFGDTTPQTVYIDADTIDSFDVWASPIPDADGNLSEITDLG